MSAVSTQELNDHLSGPRWSEAQWREAQATLDEVESGLSSALGAVPIGEGIEMRENAPVHAATGMLGTRYPVARLLALDGIELGEHDELPEGWQRDTGWLYYLGAWSGAGGIDTGAGAVTAAMSRPIVVNPVEGLGGGGVRGMLSPYAAEALDAPVSMRVAVRYLPGWAWEPGLLGAIKRKAGEYMTDRHDDTITARGLDGTRPPKPASTSWTKDELAPLARYRVVPV